MEGRKLNEIIDKLPVKGSAGNLEIQIGQIDFDSRKAGPGSLFVAVKGTQVDGHDYIGKALENGAAAILAEMPPPADLAGKTWIQVADSAAALGMVATAFYGDPSYRIRLVGVTGTNGKTTVATLLHRLFSALGYRSGLLSTVENRIGDQVLPTSHTTPDAVSLNALLARMADEGCDYAFMEVSSHAIHQKRVKGLEFTGGIFTNLTHDHLDYHGTFKAYLEAKKQFFDDLPASAFALVNADDKHGDVMVQNTRARIQRYSLRRLSDFKAKVLSNALTGLHLRIGDQEVFTRLIGEFNAYNLLAVYGSACLLDQDPTETLMALSQLTAAEGRFDYVTDPGRQITAIVDYAHTPDALEKVLETIRQVKEPRSKVITVVGCGGDRDKAKRPKMAAAACRLSDRAVLTSDNPRTEDPEAILRDMEKGIPAQAQKTTLVIADRKMAIRTAVQLAAPGDVILVAGKGHEKYQEIKGVKYPFDDKEVLKEALS
ncbi:MAG TPA: UDP-N-acetylmuramoyl-L-alanyl-D-glutamate--2,6-diaminopimelate ligase [Flavilitoribacter sp.]|nr:UDP-N-acetylmuramoyl-L-alanyl-D-glutamate--2,6-diaminopimelate ligase [Flavilitoribacter sp.]